MSVNIHGHQLCPYTHTDTNCARTHTDNNHTHVHIDTDYAGGCFVRFCTLMALDRRSSSSGRLSSTCRAQATGISAQATRRTYAMQACQAQWLRGMVGLTSSCSAQTTYTSKHSMLVYVWCTLCVWNM